MDLQLLESKHPYEIAQQHFNNLIAIDEQKEALLGMLRFFFDNTLIDKWREKHHGSELKFLDKIVKSTPLIILAGDVGCGKTELANSIATPLAKLLDKKVHCFETPTNIRGAGRVGEISNRITDAFTQAKAKIIGGRIGLLIIDEADDLATDREQNQAHHEDRSGVNVLIKQIDSISREKSSLAVILITNRLKVLDPAVIRRASQVVLFNRPNAASRKQVFESILSGVNIQKGDIDELVKASGEKNRPYTFSDLVHKIGKQAILRAIEQDRPFGKEILLEVMSTVEASPLIK